MQKEKNVIESSIGDKYYGLIINHLLIIYIPIVNSERVGLIMTDKELHKLKRAELISLLITEIEEVNELRESYNECESDYAQLYDEVEHLKQRLDDKDDKFKRLKEKLDEKDKTSSEQLERLKGKLDDKDGQIEHLKQRLHEKDIKIKNSSISDNGEASQEIAQLKELIAKKDEEFANYKKNIMETFKVKIAERDAQYKAIIEKQQKMIEHLRQQ